MGESSFSDIQNCWLLVLLLEGRVNTDLY